MDYKSLMGYNEKKKVTKKQSKPKANEVLEKGLTPQDAGYLKPQSDIGSYEEITAQYGELKCP